MKSWLTNIWNSPKSTVTAIIAAGLLATVLAQDYPTVKWLGVTATVIGTVVKLITKD